MGKASRRKHHEGEAATPVTAPWAEPPRWAAPLLALTALAGVVLGGVATWIHHGVKSSGGTFTSFCNVSETVNCDSVVTSEHAELFHLPVSSWAVVFYVVLAVVAWRARGETSPARDRARADAFALAVAGAAFSVYMAFVSFVMLRAVCLVCTALYAVSAAALFASWRLATPAAEALQRLRERARVVRRHPALAMGGAVAAGIVLLLPNWLGAPTRMTRDEVFRSNPGFYDWYTSLPVVDAKVDGGNAIGPGNAPIELVEFSDFECPHCARAHVTLKDVLSRYRREVRFVFHHFPLSNQCNDSMEGRGHEHACRAAVAAECAAQAGKFEKLANLMFAHQDALGPEALKGYARQAEIPEADFERCLTAGDAEKRVQADIAAAKRVGVRSTPTFFLNGRKIEGNLTYENWLMAFAVELDRS